VILDNGTVGFGFVNVNVNVVVAPTGTVDGANALVSLGGPITSSEALAAGALGASAVVSVLVVLVKRPGAVPLTFTVTAQLPEAGIVPPSSLIETKVSNKTPPHVFEDPASDGSTTPDGKLSVNAAAVRGTGFGLVSVSVIDVVPPSRIVVGANALPNVGAWRPT
jgi:hypothetical protein